MNTFRKEIGSEFWSVPYQEQDNGFFPEETCWFLSGRSALAGIIAEIQSKRKVNTVAMPAWCCDSMVKPFVDAGIDVRFYPVYLENGEFKQALSQAEGCDVVFLLDYFGYVKAEDVEIPPAICIHDLTHSVFSKGKTFGQYAFGSLRKWAGFLTGGFAFGIKAQNLSVNEAYVRCRDAAMRDKRKYMFGMLDSKSYLEVFAQAEEMLEESLPAKASQQDIDAAKHLDVDYIIEQRRSNAQVLLDELADVAIFKELSQSDCPLFVPIVVPNGKRNDLRNYLIRNDVFCPVHWPITQYQKPDSKSLFLYENTLSLVCDQRYTQEDMKRLIQIYNNFWKE